MTTVAFPYMPLFVDDWLSSDRIDQLASDRAYGYMLLLMHQWKDKQGYLPTNEKVLARWARLTVAEVRPLLREFFVRRNGHYYNAKCREKWLAAKERSEHAKKAGEGRWN